MTGAEKTTSNATHFVVMRYNWRVQRGLWQRRPGQLRVVSFDTRAEAEADCAQRETKAESRVNPFKCVQIFTELTDMPEANFRDSVQQNGLPLPKENATIQEWASWWNSLGATLTQQGRLAVWKACNKVRFYTVIERPVVPVGYTIVSKYWQYNDEYNYLNSEGGVIQTVYRTRAGAEKAAEKNNKGQEGASSDWLPSGVDILDPEAFWQYQTSGQTYCDIIEIELEGMQ